MLSVNGLNKNFGGLQVIKDVSFHVNEGEIHSIIGPNGAGKTTLFNLITGIYKPSQGTIRFQSAPLEGSKPHEIAKMGISRTFQNIRLFPRMSVMENVQIGQSTRVNTGLRSIFTFGSKKQDMLKREVEDLLNLVNLSHKLHMRADTLSYGEQRRLEIARALATGGKLLLLDEPAAGMNPDESAQLNQLIVKIRNSGTTILLIEHDMSVVMKISDAITVINFGQKIAGGNPISIQNDPVVREAYLGKEDDDE